MTPIIVSGPSDRPQDIERLFTVPVRTRGHFGPLPFSTPEPAESSQHLLSLTELLRLLRKQRKYLPLTILIHGWGCASSQRFFDILMRITNPPDAIWLVPTEKTRTQTGRQGNLFTSVDPMPEIPAGSTAQSDSSLIDKALVLDLGSDCDNRIYQTLVADLVFFPAIEEHERSQVAKFTDRAGVVLVDGNGAHVEAILSASANLQTFQWRGDGTKLATAEVEIATDVTTADTSPSQIELIGKDLSRLVDYYEQLFERRPYFRSDIGEVEKRYPELTRLAEGLIRQADMHNWPDWAIECLPRYYVPVEVGPDEPGAALVWHHVLACTPRQHRPAVTRSLCRGRFLEVKIEDKSALFFMETIARIFEEHTNSFPYPSERSFIFGAVNNALQIIELWLDKTDPAAASEVKELRKDVLRDGRIVQL